MQELVIISENEKVSALSSVICGLDCLSQKGMYDVSIILSDFLVAQPGACVGRLQPVYAWSAVTTSLSGMDQVWGF